MEDLRNNKMESVNLDSKALTQNSYYNSSQVVSHESTRSSQMTFMIVKGTLLSNRGNSSWSTDVYMSK